MWNLKTVADQRWMNLPGWQDWVVDVLVDLRDSLPQMLAQLSHFLAMREGLMKRN